MKIPAVHEVAVFGSTLMVYTFTMPTAITLKDAGLFQMVCHMDGIAHPPGYPLFTLLCRPFVQLPVWGDPSVVAGNLLSALFAAGAAVVFHQICMRLIDSRLFAWAAALSWAFSATFWSQAIIIEVYSLAALMFMICWRLLQVWLDSRDDRYWYALCLAVGLALSNHWPLTVLSLPALLAMVWPALDDLARRLRSPRFVLFSVVCFAMGLTPYISLLTNQQPTIAMIGAPSSFGGLVDYISRSIYSDHESAATLADHWSFVVWLLKHSLMQLGPVGVPLIVIGVLACLRSLPAHLNMTLVLIWFGTTLLLSGLLDFDFGPFRRATFRPYPVIASAAIAFWFAMGVRQVGAFVAGHMQGTLARSMTPAVSVAAIGSVLFANFADNNRREDNLTAFYGKAILSSLPADAVVLLDADHEVHVLGYLHHVEGMRADLELRQWADLVFANRLGSALDPEREKIARLEKFVGQSDKPVYSLASILKPAVDYGGYRQYSPAGNGFARAPLLEPFEDYLLDLYLHGLIRNESQYGLANQMIVNFARHHAGWLLAAPESTPPQMQERLARLQETFVGKMATLEVAVDYVGQGVERDQLLTLARLAEQQIPDHVSNARVAVFYELYGRLLTMQPSRLQEAARYFRQSIEVWPSPENRSICRLYDLQRQNNRNTGRLEQRFPLARCR